MATNTPINIITGRTGNAHIASDDDAAIWRGLLGSGDVVLLTDQTLALTDNGKQDTEGSLTIANGVFCIKNGHMGRIDNTATVTYDLPLEGDYRRTMVIIRYAKNASSIESMTLMTLQSDPQSDTSSSTSAAILPINTVPSTDYVLYDFVCDHYGMVGATLQTKLTIIDTTVSLRSMIDTEITNRQNADSAEAATREAADTALGDRVSSLETFRTNETSARRSADTALGDRVSSLETFRTNEMSARESADTALRERVSSLETFRTNETSARQSADTAINNQIDALKSWKNYTNNSLYKLIKVIPPLETGYTGVDYVVCKVGTTSYKAMWRENASSTSSYDMYFYKVTLNSAGSIAQAYFRKLSRYSLDSAISGTAIIIGNVVMYGSNLDV